MNIGAINCPQMPELSAKQKAGAGAAGFAATTAGILYAAKKGKLDAHEGGNLIVEGAKSLARGYANKLNKAGEIAGKTATAFLDKHPKINGAVETVSEKAAKAKDFAATQVNKARNFVGEKIETLGSKVKGQAVNREN